MLGRGEFAFVVLNTAKQCDLLSPNLAAGLVWTILFCILTCPILLSWLVKKDLASVTGHRHLKVSIHTKAHKNLALEINEFMHSQEINILQIHYETDHDMTTMKYQIFSENCLNKEGLHDLEAHLAKLLDNSASYLKVEPLEQQRLSLLSDSMSDEHSFILKWKLPASGAGNEITTWMLLDYITREMRKHNLLVISLNELVMKDLEFECILYVAKESKNESLHIVSFSGEEDIELETIAKIENADAISKLGMQVLKKVLHKYHIQGSTNFNQIISGEKTS